MSMNSFSFFARSDQALDSELSGLFQMQPEEKIILTGPLKELKKVNYKPVQIEKLKNKISDPLEKRRASPRVDLRLSILICSHQKAFRTTCENISLTGLKISDPLPADFADGFFEVIIIQNLYPQLKKHMLFKGRIVGGSTLSQRIQFDSMGKDSQTQLYKLIKHLLPTAS